MLVEMRRYRLVPGEIHQYVKLYKDEGYAIQSRHLGHPIGYYAPISGNQNEVTHLWKYDDQSDRDTRRAALFSDQEWLNFIAKVKPMILDMQSDFLQPVQLSKVA